MKLQASSPVQYVPRIGPAMATKLERLGITTVRDLLYHTPFRYNDFSHTTPIRQLRPGLLASCEGTVQSIRNIFTKTGKRIQEAVLTDATGSIAVIWFNQIYLPKIIHPGDVLSVSGTVGFFGNTLAIESPEYEFVTSETTKLHTGRIVPVYPETAGITSKWLRARIHALLTQYPTFVEEYLPKDILEQFHLPYLPEAVSAVHFPTTIHAGDEAKHRLAFDELVWMQCLSFEQRKIWRETRHAPACTIGENEIQQFIRSLPFTLTNGQQNAIGEIRKDLANTVPMNRLLEGDVGSGKTIVAAAAMFIASANGYQSVLMAPTQILAHQHFQTLAALLEPFHIHVELIVGGKKPTPQKTTNKEPHVYVGTHALLEETTVLKKVGFVVIDEQQRFGVQQRAEIRTKDTSNSTAHLLTMTATPIPRTLALTLYGNLDLSVLREMPLGRKPVRTWVVPLEKRDSAYAWIKKEIHTNHAQAFIICPFIEESETLSTVKAAKKEFETLKRDVFSDIPMELLHGRMKSNEKTAILERFHNQETAILIATPVVEVGIDIPNATIMMIEGSDRFGLSQLHQLRGRVGRNDKQSYCLLFSQTSDPKTHERLAILERVHNGPELAEYDLTTRGPGDLFGQRQHGIPALALASLTDEHLVQQTGRAVGILTDRDPTFQSFPHLRERLNESKIRTVTQD